MRRAIAALLVLPALFVAGCTSSSRPSGDGSSTGSQLNDQPAPGGPNGGFDGVGLDPAQPRPSFSLTDAAGASFSFARTTLGHPTLLYFGYTNCPDVCPTTMFDLGAALRTLPVAMQKEAYVVFVSTDVKRDTGAVIAKWLSNFSTGTSATWVGLHGTQAEINAAQAAAHIQLAADDGQTHSAQVLLYGPDNYARVTFVQSTNEQQSMAHDIKLVSAG